MMGKRVYFKVKPEYEGQVRYAFNNKGEEQEIELIANELLTFYELDHFHVPYPWVEQIFIYPEKITTFFGVRFLTEDCSEQVQEKLQRRNEK